MASVFGTHAGKAACIIIIIIVIRVRVTCTGGSEGSRQQAHVLDYPLTFPPRDSIPVYFTKSDDTFFFSKGSDSKDL